MPNTLTPHLDRYFRGRRLRGELEPVTARKQRLKMVPLDESFGKRPLSQWGPKAIDRWLEGIGGLAPSTRGVYVSIARGFSQWLLAERLVTCDAIAHVQRIKRPRRTPVTFTPQEVALMLAHAPDTRTTAIIWLLGDSGARTVEVARAHLDDYDPRGLAIRFVGKGGHERVVPVSHAGARALNAYLNEVGWIGGPLIRSYRHPTRGMLPSSIGRLVADTMRAAGVKARPLDGRSPHGLRRTAASMMMDNCGDIQVVQEFLGHSDISVTARHYLRRVPLDTMREAMGGMAEPCPVDPEGVVLPLRKTRAVQWPPGEAAA